MPKRKPLVIGGVTIERDTNRDIRLPVSENYTGDPIRLPVRIVSAKRPGPVVFVAAAVHGDELNGIGVIRELIYEKPVDLVRGTLILAPIVNIFGVDNLSRYLPDRRDLNRSFPGSLTGSMAARLARVFFDEVITKCDYGIDFHTAAVRRTNYPNVRGDMTDPEVRRIAKAFGCELLVNGKGPDGSLRREACKAGVPTIILEAGEVWKIEPGVVEVGLRGVHNVLLELGMLHGEPFRPVYQTRVDRSTWVRAELGGILRFHVSPGEMVMAGDPLATNASVFGHARSILISPVDGIVLGMTTMPAVKPGEPVCNLAIPRTSIATLRRKLGEAGKRTSAHRLRRQLATNIRVSELDPGDPEPNPDGD